jgi:poly-gamma-glutamate synthesis protein (capsule biosynthesis protein)
MRGIFIVLAVSWLLCLPSQAQDTLRITLTGDILLDRGVRQVIDGHGMDCLFSADIDSVLQQSDVVIGNLECPATTIVAPVMKRYVFRGEPGWLTDLRRHGVTHLNLANNHSIDQGRRGLEDTWLNISKAGMTPIGAGHNMQEAAAPVLISERPRRVWMLASLRLALENFAYLPDQPCVSQESIDSLATRITRLKAADPSCYVIVSLHWGWENHTEVLPQQREEAHRLIAAGADCLACHHPHTLQEREDYRGKPIFYSMGNFIFDAQREMNRQGCMVRLHITATEAWAEQVDTVIEKGSFKIQKLKGSYRPSA